MAKNEEAVKQDSAAERRANIIEKIKEFRLLDDDFMSKVFEDNIPATELLIHIIIGKSDLKVQTVQTQYVVKSLQGRSIRMDIHAVDADGKQYNFEIQRADKGAGAKRARYNSGMMDANFLLSGQDTDDLPETYVIFITENDVLKRGLPIYHIDRIVAETGESFGDGAHILYVNAKYRGDSDIGRLMADFNCTNPCEMNYEILAKRVSYFKEDKEGLNIMCRAVEELCNESLIEGFVEACKGFGASIGDTVKRVVQKFELSESIAEEKVKKYW